MTDQKSFQISGYLVIEATKGRYNTWYSGRIDRVVKEKPSLSNNQIAVAVNINVPIAFFERLTPVINIDLPEEAVVNPEVESIINLSSYDIAEKLHLDVVDVQDGLRQMIKEREAKNDSANK